MSGISVRGVLTSHIEGNVWSPPSHRESLLRLASVPFLRRNRTRDAVIDLPQVREVGKGRVCHKHAYAWMIDVGFFPAVAGHAHAWIFDWPSFAPSLADSGGAMEGCIKKF